MPAVVTPPRRADGKVVDGVELVLPPAPDAALLYGVTDPDDVAAA